MSDKPVELDGKPVRSVSQYNDWVQCGYAYYLKRVKKLPGLKAAWFAQGIGVHAGIQSYEESGRTLDVYDVVQIGTDEYDSRIEYDEAIEPNLSRWLTGGRVKGADDIERRRGEVERQLIEYVTTFKPNDPLRPIELYEGEYGVEIPFRLEFDEFDIVGYVDQVLSYENGSLMIRDVKAGSRQPSSDIQLGVYGVGMTELLGQSVLWGDYIMTKNNVVLQARLLTRYDRPTIEKLFKSLNDAIASNVFLPNPSDACRVCTHSTHCDFKKKSA